MDVRADITSNVPMEAGYGTSAAGTAASCLALADAAQLPVTLNQLGQITHVAEVVKGTGLGTASAVFVGGFPLVVEPGAPGVGSLDQLLFPRDHSIVCAYLGSVEKRHSLGQDGLSARVNPAARIAMNAIKAKPELRTFLSETRKFSEKAGFQTSEIARLMQNAVEAGAVGVAQNMIGHAIHAVVEDSRVVRVMKALRSTSRNAEVFASRLDNRGVRLV
jgi:pantoate kinase